jgi:hypothetical protein
VHRRVQVVATDGLLEPALSSLKLAKPADWI